MRHALSAVALLGALAVLQAGCGGGGGSVDENKPVSEVKAEAKKMDADDLRAMAEKYKQAVLAYKDDLEALEADLKEIKVTELMSEEAKELREDVKAITESMGKLQERWQVYVDALVEKGEDVSDLEAD
jgi:hypothetical protein